MAANKVAAGAGGAGGKEKEWEFATKRYLPLIKSNPETRDLPPDQQEALAYDMYQKGKGPGYQGVETKVDATAQEAFEKRFAEQMLFQQQAYKKAEKTGDTAAMERIRQQAAEKARAPSLKNTAPTAAPAPAPAPMQAPKDLNTFLEAARKANKGVSDADLTAYYNSKYNK
jgi:hypothetical protein